jgi:NAD-dependent deacetylase
MKLKDIIQNSDSIVFFGGAGVSTESGIPDFRSVDGLYSLKYKYPPETMLSRSFFDSHTSEYFHFYRDKIIHAKAQPNKAHIALAKLEAQGKVQAVITQNIDGLHSKAGSVNVLELHGSVYRNYCMECKRFYPLDAITEADDIPRCSCGGIIKPDVVLYEEGLDESIMAKSTAAVRDAEVLIVGGTSLNVYPAAGLLRYYGDSKLILINKSETPYDSHANLIIRESIGETLGAAVE